VYFFYFCYKRNFCCSAALFLVDLFIHGIRPLSETLLVCYYINQWIFVVTFRVTRSRGEMYSGHDRLCVCLSVSVPRRIPTLLHGPECKLGGMVVGAP